ncbi:MAG: hypothetical protein FWD17_12805 [Polyangiaceae bacterium]|nr:hypothetical protein [Polyangiaceae bacterium]
MKIIARIVGLVSASVLAACAMEASPETTQSTSSDLIANRHPDAGCAGVGAVFCINGGHWDPNLCRCVPPDGGCVDNVLCISGDHWDPNLCRCVPDANGCTTASDCRGPLPQFCLVCSDGIAACAHWACVAGQCEVATCN